MKSVRWLLCGVVILAFSMPCGVVAQTIEGVLLDRDNNSPIELGLVTLLTEEGDSVAAALTGQGGRFRVRSATPGEFLLAATALGYRSTLAGSVFALGDSSSMSIEFRLEPVPVDIGGLVVDIGSSMQNQPNLVRNGFVDRARGGMGRFITPAQIEQATAISTTDLLRRTGRITTRYAIGGDRILMRGLLGFCTPLVYVDGQRVSMGAGMSLDAFVPLHTLDAVEVYRSPVEAPPQYAAGAWRCGVLVLWTKTR